MRDSLDWQLIEGSFRLTEVFSEGLVPHRLVALARLIRSPPESLQNIVNAVYVLLAMIFIR